MITTVLNSFTIAFILTIIIYFLLYKSVIKKIELSRKISLFLLIGWFVMFLQITIFSDTFTSAISGEVKLSPFHTITEDLFISGQLDIVKQFLLNVLMFFPFGFLFPILKKNNCSLTTILIGLSITMIIETLQIFIGRSFDIDDIIANFIGVILGLGYYLIVITFNKYRNKNKITSYNYLSNLLTIVLTVVLIAFPFYAKDTISNNTNGFFLYTHERPTNIIYNTKIDANIVEGSIYNAMPVLSEKSFKEIMKNSFNIDLTNVNKTEDDVISYDTEQVSLTYHADGSMDIVSKNQKVPLLIANDNNNDYQESALLYLKQIYEIDDLFSSPKISLREIENKKELVIELNKTLNNELYFGEIYVTMDDAKNLLAIHSTLIKGEIKKSIKLTSPLQASKLISKTGNFNKKLEVAVNTIKHSYYYNQQTKTLIPTWYFEGIRNDSTSSWSANINALKN